ncbi:MAG: CaiB/BaiF CoA transferase family protein [Gammaproteobacteria bacterium]
MNGLLEGVRVLDLTIVVMGPYATQVMADFGADVIKIESPQGDTTRKIGPMRNPDMGNVFLHLNRNKRSVVLDLKQPDGLEALFALARDADVLVYNIRPRAMARLGITHERLAAVNPRIITAGLVGFDQRGPYAAEPVYEDLIQGLTAVPSMLTASGADHPIYVPMAFNDRAVGLYACNAILAALLGRARTGRGMEIEIPMFETMVHGTLIEHMSGQSFDPPLGPPGYPRSLNRERRPFATRDGYICAVIYTDNHWRAFMDLIGRGEEFRTDPRLRDITARTVHAHAIYAMIGEAMRTRTTAEWMQALRQADIPAAPLHTLDSLLADPHLAATGFFSTTTHPTEGALRTMAVPGRFSEGQRTLRRHPPRLGEHSVEVLREAGLDEARIDHMLASRAAVQSR